MYYSTNYISPIIEIELTEERDPDVLALLGAALGLLLLAWNQKVDHISPAMHIYIYGEKLQEQLNIHTQSPNRKFVQQVWLLQRVLAIMHQQIWPKINR